MKSNRSKQSKGKKESNFESSKGNKKSTTKNEYNTTALVENIVKTEEIEKENITPNEKEKEKGDEVSSIDSSIKSENSEHSENFEELLKNAEIVKIPSFHKTEISSG